MRARIQSVASALLTLTALLGLGGCGGGGAGGATPNPPPTGPSLAQLASATTSAAITAGVAASTSTSALGQPQQTTATPSGGAGVGSAAPVLAALPFTCKNSGNFNILWSDANTNSVRDEGENFALNFAYCKTSDTSVVNGGMVVTFSQYARDADGWLHAAVDIDFRTLQIQTDAGGARMNGTLHAERTDSAEQAILHATSPSFSGTSINLVGLDVASLTITNLALTDTALASGVETLEVSAQVSGSWPGFTGALAITTPQMLTLGTGGIPTAGTLVSVSSAGTLTLRFAADQSAMATLDRNNDGVIDSQAQISRSELLGN